ncbi:SRPBCC family protein [Chitinophaga pinensis]|uniref:Activator of Hsp90 ATPase 1 family protein n=1 Tax=Chitinophaga pinensis (strain ATCC 43595 / DSM 2588 / LMG 13176 / NBRC 15968 / NCIMB 11800 / UQM 2034) TaxID=485918 RepID=A0A979G4J9_CHIPD|nr:SRPBCC family protein [Chitinophaga pinensis]ACU60720.1 Activator of Hsp90 ATPase 1 family protein [Chitinophaga pinensis DSM 2588]
MKDQTIIEAQMLIRKPASEVFDAFIDPEKTRHFWFTKASGKLEKGKTITWEWEMYKVSTQVIVKEIVPDEQITIAWNSPATTVEFIFNAVSADQTYVIIKNYGFGQQGADLVKEVMNNTGGFTTVLDGLKAYMEHGINLNLIADKFPAGK